MNGMCHSFTAYTQNLITIGILTLLLTPIGCGAVGPPIPPEDVGIEAKIRKQQQDQAKKEGLTTEEQTDSPVEEPVELPPLYPIGTR
jgi:hypothetical protein